MKIKNSNVKISLNGKIFNFQNTILKGYTKKFVDSQLEKDYSLFNAGKYAKKLNYILLKFDEPLDFDENSILQNTDFDVVLTMDVVNNVTAGNNQIVVDYLYSRQTKIAVYDYNERKNGYLEDYADKQITAIGFNTNFIPNRPDAFPVCSCLDTLNYNLYVTRNTQFTASRKDVFEIDGLFKSELENINFPLHLNPISFTEKADAWASEKHTPAYALLKSVGLSSGSDLILDKEFDIDDLGYEKNEEEIIINEIDNYLIEGLLFPNESLFPNNEIYPISAEARYIVLKYVVLQGDYDGESATSENTDWIERGYYYIGFPIDKYGKSKIKIKYERN